MKRIENIFVRALIVGLAFGFGLVMIATVIHISLTRNLTMDHLLINCVWQIGEQTFGVLIMATLKLFIRDDRKELAHEIINVHTHEEN